MKKIICLVLTILMVCSLFAGCGGGGEVTLKWATSLVGQADEAKVLEVVNKKLETLLPGVQMEFIEFDPTKWSKQMAAGEKIDIARTGYILNMEAEITNESYLALNDYITEEKTPNLYREWKTEYVDDYMSGTVDGKLYAIPNQQPLISESPYIKIPAELIEYFDVEGFRKACAASATTTREVYEILDKYFKTVWENEAYDTDYVGTSIDIIYLYGYFAMRGYSKVDENTPLVYKTFDKEAKIVSKYETDEFKLFLEYAAKWYEDGYISADVLVNQGSSGSRLPVISAHENGTYYKLDDEKNGIREMYDVDGYLEQYYINIEPADHSHSALGASILGAEKTYLALPFTCTDPEAALSLIDLLRSPIGTEGNELYNLLCFGFEKNSEYAQEYGTYHYELKDEDQVVAVDYTLQASANSMYGRPHWQIGNVFLALRTPDIVKGQQEYARNYEQKVMKEFHKTPLYGFRADLSAKATPIGNCNSVIEEYEDRLTCGVEGAKYEALLKTFIDKLKVAGIEELITELQTQADAFTNK